MLKRYIYIYINDSNALGKHLNLFPSQQDSFIYQGKLNETENTFYVSAPGMLNALRYT